MSLYGPTRNVDMGKQEAELSVNIKKATSIDEVAPKRKHVRACIVYTWDHKSSQSFWAGMKVCVAELDCCFVNLWAHHPPQATNSRRRSPDFQSTHHHPQGPPGRAPERSQRSTRAGWLDRQSTTGGRWRCRHARLRQVDRGICLLLAC